MKKVLVLFLVFGISFSQQTKKCATKSSQISLNRANHIQVQEINLITVPVHFIIVHKPNEEIGEGRKSRYRLGTKTNTKDSSGKTTIGRQQIIQKKRKYAESVNFRYLQKG